MLIHPVITPVEKEVINSSPINGLTRAFVEECQTPRADRGELSAHKELLPDTEQDQQPAQDLQ